jgi:hypothetical protein
MKAMGDKYHEIGGELFVGATTASTIDAAPGSRINPDPVVPTRCQRHSHAATRL